MNGNTIRTITIRGQAEGLDKLTADINKLAAAEQNVAVVSEQSAKRVLSLEDAWKRQTLKLDEAARAQANIARETKLADQALREGLATQQQHAQRLEQINQRYNTASQSTQKFAQQTGLARHELINLGRQAQDVGVSLASGQSPLTVLFQQGSQIADVFVSSRASVGSFFTQAIGWAGRFVGSVAGITTAVVGTTAAVGYMVSSFASAQKEIEKVLSGTGAASGATRGGINRIAEGAAGGGLSIAAVREAAAAFAATGKIYEQNINTATNITREFAKALGVDATDATKQLAAALADPSKGALELNKSIRFLDADTLKYIMTLQSMGRLQEAQNALMLAAAPAIGKQAEQVGLLTRAWNAAKAALDDFDEANAKAIARSLERMTGAELGGFTDQERLGVARSRLGAARQGAAQLGPSDARLPFALKDIQQLEAGVARLEERLAGVAKQTAAARFAQLSLDAQAFGQSLDQTAVKIETLTAGLGKIAEYQAARLNQGLALDPALERQQKIGSVILAQTIEQQQAEQTKAAVIADNALKYQNVSISAAQTLEQMQAQLPVAQAVTGAAEIQAQHHATIVQLLGTANTSLVTQQQLTGAISIADAQRENTLARVNAEAERTLRALQLEGEIIRATSEDEKDRIRARQTYNDLINKGVDSEKAGAVAAQQAANARSTRDAKEQADAEQEAASAAQARAKANADAADAAVSAYNAELRSRQEMDKMNVAARQFSGLLIDWHYRWGDLAESISEVFGNLKEGVDIWTSASGKISQFDPAGYKSTTSTMGANKPEDLTKVFSDLWTGQFNAAFTQSGGDIGKAVDSLISSGKLFTGTTYDPVQQKVTALSSAIDLLPKEQQVGPYQQMLQQLQATPVTLETVPLVKQLTDKIAELTQATDANTSATSAMTDVLSPFYSSDPRSTHLGFRSFAGGGIMTPYGALPLKQYADGGMATSPQVAIFGEGSTPEAYVPAPAGRIPVEVRTPANTNQKQMRPVTVNIVVQGNADSGTVSALKQTAFQQAQAMRRIAG